MRWRTSLLAIALLAATLLLWTHQNSTEGAAYVEGGKGFQFVLPSVVTGLMSTPNDATDDGHAAVGVTPSPVVDSLLEGRGAARGQGASEEAAASSCEAALAAMEPLFSQVKQAHEAGRGVEQPDLWTGPSPLCGIHKLFNLTGIVLALSAKEHAAGRSNESAAARPPHRIRTHSTSEFLVRACLRGRPEKPRSSSSPPASGGGCADVYLAARLVGPTIVNAEISRTARRRESHGGGSDDVGECNFAVRVHPLDPGAYELEVQVAWLNSMGPEDTMSPSSPVTLRKIHSKFGRKPHQRYVFNAVCEAQTHVLGSPLAIEVVAAAEEEDKQPSAAVATAALPVCSRGTFPEGGRWVANDNDRPCNGSNPFCVGHPQLLNDAKPFNENFLWAPIGCRFRFYGRGEGPASSCVRRKGTMLLMGDSTTREYAQSLRLLDLSRTGLTVSYANWKLEWQFFSRRMAEESLQRLGQELRKSRPTVLVANLGPLHLIGGLKTSEWKYYVDQWVAMLKSNALEFLERKIFLGPAAIHYATNDMTAPRMRLWMEYALQQLEPLGFELLDGWTVTQSRPESTWDGVHYSAERGKAQMKHIRRRRPVFKWNGGVSIMLATILISMLCEGNATTTR